MLPRYPSRPADITEEQRTQYIQVSEHAMAVITPETAWLKSALFPPWHARLLRWLRRRLTKQ